MTAVSPDESPSLAEEAEHRLRPNHRRNRCSASSASEGLSSGDTAVMG